MTYPEHDKLRAVAKESQTCGEFLEWLTGPQGYTLGEYHLHVDECCVDGTRICDMSNRALYPAPINVRRLLATFFEIDETKLEDEKRSMLNSLNQSESAP